MNTYLINSIICFLSFIALKYSIDSNQKEFDDENKKMKTTILFIMFFIPAMISLYYFIDYKISKIETKYIRIQRDNIESINEPIITPFGKLIKLNGWAIYDENKEQYLLLQDKINISSIETKIEYKKVMQYKIIEKIE